MVCQQIVKICELQTVRGEPVEPPFDTLRANGTNLVLETRGIVHDI